MNWAAPIRHQINLMALAIGFFTRIPMPQQLEYSPQRLNSSARYFTFVGWIIAAASALIFLTLNLWLPQDLAILLTMIAGLFLTGGFHEDGLADTCDGLGGGWTKDQKLNIMKDSRLGSYGALGLWSALTTKFIALQHLPNIALVLLVAHPLSRAMSSALIYFMPYVSSELSSKSKPIAHHMRLNELLCNLIIAAPALLIFPDALLPLMISCVAVTGVCALLFQRQLGGITGDTLGCTQQVIEIVIYLVLVTQFGAVK